MAVAERIETLEQAAEAIRRGGVVAFRTDTFYGLGVDPFNREASEHWPLTGINAALRRLHLDFMSSPSFSQFGQRKELRRGNAITITDPGFNCHRRIDCRRSAARLALPVGWPEK